MDVLIVKLGAIGDVVMALPMLAAARSLAPEQPWRRWPVDRYASAGRHLIAKGCRVVLIGSDTDAYVRPAFAGLPI